MAEVEATLTAGQSVTLDVVLVPAAFTLDDIVVTALGDQSKREIGNQVEVIPAAELVREAPITNVQDLLNSRVPGVTVSSGDGSVGAGTRIRIRGLSSATLANDPLVYVDGVRINGTTPEPSLTAGAVPSLFNELTAEDIQSLEVVKGPSASTLYGTQAANGVIRITTKRGQPGPARWHGYVEQGVIQDRSTYPDVFFSQGHVPGNPSIVRPCFSFHAALGQCVVDQLYSHNLMERDDFSPLKTGRRQRYGLNVGGGSAVVRYYMGADIESETGTLTMPDEQRRALALERGTDQLNPWEEEPNDLTRAGVRANVDISLSENAEVGVSTSALTSDMQLAQTWSPSSIYGAAINGTADPAAPSPWGAAPPSEGLARRSARGNDRFTASTFAQWRVTPFVDVRGTVGFDYLNYTDEGFNFAGQGCRTCAGERAGSRTLNRFRSATAYGDLAVTARYGLSQRIAAKTALGVQYTQDELNGSLNSARGLAPGAQTIDAGATKTSSEVNSEDRTLGVYVEQSVSWDARLFVTAALRRDGNSSFGDNARTAWYPKASVSWILRDGAAGTVGPVRARAAFGISGLQPRPGSALTFLTPVASTLPGGSVSGVTLGGVGDPSLKPERSREIELGADVGLWSGRANVELTYYHKRTTDALVDRPIPGSLGATSTRLENLGTVTNEGIEIGLSALLVDRADLRWDVGVSFAGNRNRLVELAEGSTRLVSLFGDAQSVPGYPLWGAWGRSVVSFDDANGDGVIVPPEVVVSDTLEFHGSTNPTRTLTLNTGVGVLGDRFVLRGLLDYRGGFVVRNLNNALQCLLAGACRALNDPSASLEEQAQILAVFAGQNTGPYDEDATFVKLREVSLTFNFPQRWTEVIHSRNASLTLKGRNLVTWTDYPSWDPETRSSNTDSNIFSWLAAGNLRRFTLRLDLFY